MAQTVLVVGGVVHDVLAAPEDHTLADLYPEAYLAQCIAAPDGITTGWTFDGKTFAAPVPIVVPPIDLRAYAAEARYAKETGGITVSGVKVATDEGSQAKIGNAYVLLQASGAASIEFKGSDGAFATLSADQFKSLALAVGAHVQGCFAAEGQVVADIVAGKVTTSAQVDAAFAAVTA